jgi:hypothetical protein
MGISLLFLKIATLIKRFLSIYQSMKKNLNFDIITVKESSK